MEFLTESPLLRFPFSNNNGVRGILRRGGKSQGTHTNYYSKKANGGRKRQYIRRGEEHQQSICNGMIMFKSK